MGVVQQPAATLVETLPTVAAAKPAVAPGRAIRPLRHRGGAAGYTVHSQVHPAGPGTYRHRPDQPNRPPGASSDRTATIARVQHRREGLRFPSGAIDEEWAVLEPR
jgi:hypothetical protein